VCLQPISEHHKYHIDTCAIKSQNNVNISGELTYIIRLP